MSANPDNHYNDLAAWAASDAPGLAADAVIYRGEEAREASRALLQAATEDDPPSRELLRAATRGRPSLDPDAPAGESPLWQLRAPASLDHAMRARAEAEGRSLSAVLRDAAAFYLANHHPT